MWIGGYVKTWNAPACCVRDGIVCAYRIKATGLFSTKSKESACGHMYYTGKSRGEIVGERDVDIHIEYFTSNIPKCATSGKRSWKTLASGETYGTRKSIMVTSKTFEDTVNFYKETIREMEEQNAELLKDRLRKETTCRKAVETFGKQMQMIVAIEELAELIQSLTKVLRFRPDFENVAEETADAEIAIEELKIMFNNRKDVEDWTTKKLVRLEDRVKRGVDGG